MKKALGFASSVIGFKLFAFCALAAAYSIAMMFLLFFAIRSERAFTKVSQREPRFLDIIGDGRPQTKRTNSHLLLICPQVKTWPCE